VFCFAFSFRPSGSAHTLTLNSIGTSNRLSVDDSGFAIDLVRDFALGLPSLVCQLFEDLLKGAAEPGRCPNLNFRQIAEDVGSPSPGDAVKTCAVYKGRT
jgi:hypothetical protein